MAINLVTVAVALARRPHQVRDGVKRWSFDDASGFRYVVEQSETHPRFRVECWHGSEFVVSCPASTAPHAASLVASISEGS
jgi:hypothetical protein